MAGDTTQANPKKTAIILRMSTETFAALERDTKMDIDLTGQPVTSYYICIIMTCQTELDVETLHRRFMFYDESNHDWRVFSRTLRTNDTSKQARRRPAKTSRQYCRPPDR